MLFKKNIFNPVLWYRPCHKNLEKYILCKRPKTSSYFVYEYTFIVIFLKTWKIFLTFQVAKTMRSTSYKVLESFILLIYQSITGQLSPS